MCSSKLLQQVGTDQQNHAIVRVDTKYFSKYHARSIENQIVHLIDIIAHGSHRVATAQRTGNLLALCLDTKITAGQYRVSGKDLVV